MLEFKSKLKALGIEEFRIVGHNLEVHNPVALNTEQSLLLSELPMSIKFLSNSSIEDIYKNIKLITPLYSTSVVRENLSDLVIKGYESSAYTLNLSGDPGILLKDTKVFGSTLNLRDLTLNGLAMKKSILSADECVLKDLEFNEVWCQFRKTPIDKGVFKDCLSVHLTPRAPRDYAGIGVEIDVTVDNTRTFTLEGSYSGSLYLNNIKDCYIDISNVKNKLDISGNLKSLAVYGVKSKAKLREYFPNLEFERMIILRERAKLLGYEW